MSDRISKMITAMREMTSEPEDASGLFGRVVSVQTPSLTLNGEELDIEFDIPFDDNTEANEAEIIVYNLSENSASLLRNNDVIVVTAGYRNGTGVIFSGRISKTITRAVGVDKKTTIYAIDDMNLQEKDVEEIAYVAGTKASHILKDLVNRLKLPVAVFEIRHDHSFENAVNVSGGLMQNIEKYAQICGVSAFILKSSVYVQHLKNAKGDVFKLSADTGLIDSPSEFEEKVKEENYTETVKGYKLKMLLHYQVTVGSIIELDSVNAKGRFVVREGKHRYSGNDFVTEVTIIA